MGLLQLIAHWTGEGKLTELAETIAARSFDHVWKRVQKRVETLGPNELRGYLRARTLHLVQQQIVELGRQGLVVKATHLDKLILMTFDILQRQITVRVQAQQMARERVRRAA